VKTARAILTALPLAAAVGCGSYNSPTGSDLPKPSRVVTGGGDVTSFVAEFRGVLGDPNNGGTAGSQAAGRREINWDGVPAAVTNNDDFPGDFFNTRSPRGVVFTTPGRGFRASDSNVADLDPSYSQEFAFFSARKTFLPAGSNVMEASFQVPGGTAPAAVRGFGVVFSDVDRAGSATIEYFGAQGSLGAYEAPARGAGGSLSFLGVAFADRIVTRVRIVSGRGALGPGVKDISAGGSLDLVIMDDFLYDEPVALP
jgi:hypothetical protein